ncbi:MAG TPA: MucR family transcriptional regulator [Candidatus Binataceae bacterium]|nr:MucR family transcriptional regulator [Candidatus Binataceae bacterium]
MKKRAASIVSAYVEHNAVAPGDVPALIASVATALSELGREPGAAPEAPALTPAVPIRRSVTANTITCLDCGWSGTMLRRHLSNAHWLSPEQYRERWGLPRDYPLVPKQYSAMRSQMAKSIGFGTRGGRGRSAG